MKTKDDLTVEQLELIQAVQKINNELHDKFGWNNQKLPSLSVSITSYTYFVSLNYKHHSIILLSSGDEQRKYYLLSGKYETFYSAIKRLFREFKNELDEIKL